MMLIPCPWCGPRDITEFTYAGEANVQEPAAGAPLEAWTTHVYLRDNVRGMHEELWQHGAGCRRYIRVTRDTLTHEVTGSTPAKAP